MAELVAKSCGAAYRLRWVREEFGLPASSRQSRTSNAVDAQSGERQRLARPLEALRSVGEDRNPALYPDELLCSIVTELREAFGARRALTYRLDANRQLSRIDSVSAGGSVADDRQSDPAAALLHEAALSRCVVIVDDAEAMCSRAVLPVSLDEATWGIVCLERP